MKSTSTAPICRPIAKRFSCNAVWGPVLPTVGYWLIAWLGEMRFFSMVPNPHYSRNSSRGDGKARETRRAQLSRLWVLKTSSAAREHGYSDENQVFWACDGVRRACFEVAFGVPVGLPLDANAAGIPVPLSWCADDGSVQAATRS